MRKKVRNKRLYLLETLVFLLLIVSYIQIQDKRILNKPSQVESGFLDLTQWQADDTLTLDGTWEFYPHRLLDPTALNFDAHRSDVHFIQVPASLSQTSNNSFTSGTYRLRIQVPEDGMFAIKTRTIRSAYNLYINGILLHTSGTTSTNIQEVEINSRYAMLPFRSLDQHIELVIQVASDERSLNVSGIINSIEFGTYPMIQRQHYMDVALSMITITLLFTVGAYFIVRFLFQRSLVHNFYFGWMSIIFAFFLSLMDEQIMSIFINYNFTQRLALQGLCATSLIIVMSHFIDSVFDRVIPKSFIQFANRLILFSTALIALNALFFNLDSSFFYMIYLFGLINSVLYSLVTAFMSLKKSDETTNFAYIFLLNISTYLGLTYLRMLYPINLYHLPLFFGLVLAISGSLLLSKIDVSNYRKNEELTEDLFDSYRRQNRFFNNFVPEVRDGIQKIYELNESIFEQESTPLNPDHLKIISDINQESLRLFGLLDIVSFSSDTVTTTYNEAPSNIHVETMVDEVLRDLSDLFPLSTDIKITTYISKGFPTFVFSYNRAYQVLYELILNALENTHVGSITISFSVKNNHAIISIADTGNGIPEKHIDKVFLPMHQVDPVDNKYGLGLTFSKKFIESVGGNISIESKEEIGTKVTIQLPIENNTNRTTQGVSTSQDASSFTGPEILIIKKNDLERIRIKNILRNHNFNVNVLSQLSVLKTTLESHTPKLIILDWNVNDVSFTEFSKVIRERFDSYEIPILLLGTATNLGHVDMIEAQGITEFLHKPINIIELLTRVNFILESISATERHRNKELQFLYSQISPHFLHNTLSNVIGLIGKEDAIAKETIINLSIYLRAKLNIHKRHARIPLEDEIEVILSYLDIEKLRYDNKLFIESDIKAYQTYIPPLSLQPLVENAIEHGFKHNEPLTIKIKTHSEDGFVIILIEDDGVGMDEVTLQNALENKSGRIGLASTIKRINILPQASFEIESSLNKGTRILIRLKELNHEESHNN